MDNRQDFNPDFDTINHNIGGPTRDPPASTRNTAAPTRSSVHAQKCFSPAHEVKGEPEGGNRAVLADKILYLIEVRKRRDRPGDIH